jgi:hypothetical protein
MSFIKLRIREWDVILMIMSFFTEEKKLVSFLFLKKKLSRHFGIRQAELMPFDRKMMNSSMCVMVMMILMEISDPI